MPHVDEGTLHALLDGALRAEEPGRATEVEAHLRGCPDCRALLEEAAGLRADASDILSAAAPVATPAADFADVRARAARARTEGADARAPRARRRSGRARQLQWTAGLAWAASLVLALGTGYLLRDLVGPGSTTDERPMAESVESTRQRALDAPGPAAPGPASAADAGAGADAEAPVPTPAPTPSAALAGEAADRSGNTVETGLSVGAQGVEAAGDRALERESVALEEIVVTGGAGAEKARLEPPATLQSRPPVMSRSAAMGGALGESWSSATLTQARAALGGPVYRLPRSRIEEMYVDAGPAAPRVLTRQRLESGVPVRVIQWPGAAVAAHAGGAAEAAPAEDADAPGGLPTAEVARVTVGRYVLEVTGSLPADLLAILAESASPVP